MSVDAISTLERGTRRSPQRQTMSLLIDALGLDGTLRAEFESAAARSSAQRRRGRDVPPFQPAPLKRNHNVPVPFTSFVGRSHEVAMLRERLASDRLITLAGTGGVGKTRLAIEVAQTVTDRFADGVWFVELVEIHDPALIVAATCAAIGVHEEPGVPPLDTLIAALAPSEYLLVIDNGEHLVAAVAALVGTLLARSPRLRVMVTSREPLRVIGERVHRVAPLDIGAPNDGEPAAFTLFVDRARAANADVRLDDRAREAVHTIVRRLDGIPLAIELAAARVGVFSIAAIADRLDRRLGVPGAAHRAPASQEMTLRSLIDWSYDLLEPIERTLFRRLSVFAGSFTLEAIETIVADAPFEHTDLFATLSRLADKSMIVADPGNDRFRMLETMREYALEKLTSEGESQRYIAQHAAYYLDYAARAGDVLRGPQQFQAFAALTIELGNIRAALDATVDLLDRDERALRGLAAMMDYWQLAGSNAELRARLSVVERLALPPSITLAMIYFAATAIAISGRAFGDARRFAAAAAAACAQTPNAVLELNLAAADLLAEVLDTAPVPVDRIDTLRRHADRVADASLLQTVATAQGFDAVARGDVVAAHRHFEEAFAFSSEIGDPMTVAAAALVLCRFALIESEPARAARLLADAIPALAQREHQASLATALDGLVVVAAALGEQRRAALFLGAARRMHRVSGASTVSSLAPSIPDEVVASLETALGSAAFAERVAEGERAFVADVVDAVRAFTLDALSPTVT